MSKKIKLWALIIGINDYPSSPLYGCVPDAKAIQQYLESEPRFDTQGSILALHDKAATKANIAQAILDHLGQAQAGDTALIYFSGHGAQERADAALWPQELDGCLETIACYAPPGQPPALLADKELRYLLYRATCGSPEQPKSPPHLVAVFDCCHSGDNTRSAALLQGEARERRFTNIFPQRPWEDFLFADTLHPDELANGDAAVLLPNAPHVQLAAAKDDQAALEVGGQGVFTKYLLQCLQQSGGSLDYLSLHRLLSNYIRFKHQQNPQVSSLGAGMELLHQGFLGLAPTFDGQLYARANYSDTKGWLLDMGLMHGLQDGDELQLFADEQNTIACKVNEALDVSSTLDIDFEARRELDKRKSYKVEVPVMQRYPIHVFFDQEADEPGFQKALSQSLAVLKEPILLTDTEENADYVVRRHSGLAYITAAFDPYRPLAEVAELDAQGEKQTIVQLTAQLQMAAQWTAAYQLHNSKVAALSHPPLGVEVYQQKGQDWQQVLARGEAFRVTEVHRNPAGKYQAKVKVRLTNQYSQPLYFCLLVLSEQRESQLSVDTSRVPGLVEQPVTMLPPGQSMWLFGHRGGVIPYSIGPEVIFQNRPYGRSWFKLIVSTKTEIAYSHLIVPRSRMVLDFEAPVDDWTTQRLELQMANPAYNTVSQEALAEWMADPLRAPLAAKLYEGIKPN